MTSTKIKNFAIASLIFFTVLALAGVKLASQVSTNYSMDQFLPKKHPMITSDQINKKVFHISEVSPHILLIEIPKSEKSRWYDTAQIDRLKALTEKIQALKNVKSVISLGNVRSVMEQDHSLTVNDLPTLLKQGMHPKEIMSNPLYNPNLISKDAKLTALFITPDTISQADHKLLMGKISHVAEKKFPHYEVRIGGPAAIRTQVVDLLSQEILIFVLLSLLCALIVVKVMFHGYAIIPQMLFLLAIVNAIVFGIMGTFGFSLNLLSSTLPILVTISGLGIATHTLVRMSIGADLEWSDRMIFLRALLKELAVPHLLTAVTTSIGFATLISSHVPMISEYGKAVSMGVLLASVITLALIPSMYVLLKWPEPREFLDSASTFAHFLVREAKWIVPSIGIAVVLLGLVGTRLSWTAKIFDDLPNNYSTRTSTQKIGSDLGGVSPLSFTVGSNRYQNPWKNPAHLRALKEISDSWRREGKIGSVLSLADFLATKASPVPLKRETVTELEFLYSMSGENPLEQFLSSDEKWTRISLRLPDLPANQLQVLIKQMEIQLIHKFPGMEVKTSGMAAMLPTMNDDVSRELMWGFFESLFWIVLILAIVFRSLRWALFAVIPNLVPPALLLGFLALFQVSIKPGIAIIFSISLGLAFCNTVYILERLKQILKFRGPRSQTLPVYSLMKQETMPCLVSSLSLLAGFSVFLFSVFPVNQLFGIFMLLSISAGILGDLIWLPTLLRKYPWLLLENWEMKVPAVINEKVLSKLPAWMKPTRFASYALLFALGLVAFRTGHATESVVDILSKVEKAAKTPNERAALKMTTESADGSKKVRELTILRKSSDGERAMIRLQKPADLKGLSLLTVAKGKQEEQYLYLPSDKKVRRILGSNKKGKFLDSEIAFEDLSVSTYKSFNNRVLASTSSQVQIESKAKSNSDSSYGKILTWVELPTYRVDRVEYFDKAGKLLKHARFSNYEKVDGKYWRARNLTVQNVQTKRKTSLIIEKMSSKPINAEEVSVAALED